VKNIMSLKPYTPAMIALECAIYKKKMMTLVTLLERCKCSLKEFARDKLNLNLPTFLALKKKCIQEVPLDESSKKHINKISEFLNIKITEQRLRYEAYNRQIKGKHFCFIRKLTKL
jgi:hypothetical protein